MFRFTSVSFYPVSVSLSSVDSGTPSITYEVEIDPGENPREFLKKEMPLMYQYGVLNLKTSPATISLIGHRRISSYAESPEFKELNESLKQKYKEQINPGSADSDKQMQQVDARFIGLSNLVACCNICLRKKPLPPKGRNIEDYQVIGPLNPGPLNVSTHKVYKAIKKSENGNERKIENEKTDKINDKEQDKEKSKVIKIANPREGKSFKLEALIANLFKRFLGYGLNLKTLHDENKKTVGSISTYKSGYKSTFDFILECLEQVTEVNESSLTDESQQRIAIDKAIQRLKQSELASVTNKIARTMIYAGLAQLAVFAYVLDMNDLHSGNYGFMEISGELRMIIMDNGWSLARLDKDPLSENFQLSAKGFADFPMRSWSEHGLKWRPHNWFDVREKQRRIPTERNIHALIDTKKISEDTIFQKQKCEAFFKVILLDVDTLFNVARQFMPEHQAQKYVEFLINRQKKLQELLLKIDEFINFVHEHGEEFYKMLMKQLEEHNACLVDPNDPGRANLDKVTQHYEAIMAFVTEEMQKREMAQMEQDIVEIELNMRINEEKFKATATCKDLLCKAKDNNSISKLVKAGDEVFENTRDTQVIKDIAVVYKLFVDLIGNQKCVSEHSLTSAKRMALRHIQSNRENYTNESELDSFMKEIAIFNYPVEKAENTSASSADHVITPRRCLPVR